MLKYFISFNDKSQYIIQIINCKNIKILFLKSYISFSNVINLKDSFSFSKFVHRVNKGSRIEKHHQEIRICAVENRRLALVATSSILGQRPVLFFT